MIKVIYMDTTIFKNKMLYEKAFSLVSKERQGKVSAFKNVNAARLSLGAGLLLYIALQENGLEEHINSLCYELHGKPYFKDIDFHFSLSHSGKYAICAYGTTPLGIDIQKTDRPIKHVKRILSEDERVYLRFFDEAEKAEVSYRLWVRKESLIKLDGRGLRMPLDKLSFISDHSVSDSLIFEGKKLYFIEKKNLLPAYAICVCSEIENEAIRLTEISAEFLTKY